MRTHRRRAGRRIELLLERDDVGGGREENEDRMDMFQPDKGAEPVDSLLDVKAVHDRATPIGRHPETVEGRRDERRRERLDAERP